MPSLLLIAIATAIIVRKNIALRARSSSLGVFTPHHEGKASTWTSRIPEVDLDLHECMAR